MILVLEIFLTVKAWRKGWGVRGLLPMGIALAIGLTVGGLIAASGGSIEPQHQLALLPIDLATVGVLIAMVKRAPMSAPSSGYPALSEASISEAPAKAA
jgi:hypothetical protein